MEQVGEDALDMEVVAARHRVPPVAVASGLADCAEAVLEHGALAAAEQARLQVQRSHRVLDIPIVHRPRTTAALDGAQRALDHPPEPHFGEPRVLAHELVPPRKQVCHFKDVTAAPGHLLHQRVAHKTPQVAHKALHFGQKGHVRR